MKKIRPIETLPEWDWTEHSLKEITETGAELVDQTDFIWQVGNAVVAGFIYHNFLNAPWMWFVLSKDVTIGDLVDFRRVCKLIPKGTLTAVEASYKKGLRFAELYEFEDTGSTHKVRDVEYKIFRRK